MNGGLHSGLKVLLESPYIYETRIKFIRMHLNLKISFMMICLYFQVSGMIVLKCTVVGIVVVVVSGAIQYSNTVQ